MAGSKKRADGRLQKSFTYNNKRYYVYGKDKDEIDEKIFTKKLELRQAKEMHDNPTFQVFYKRWVNNRRDSVTEATLRAQQCHYNTVSKVVIDGKEFKDYKLQDIKAEDIRVIQRALVESGNKTQTINDKISFISHIFHDAILEQYITFNPCTPVKPLKKKEVASRDSNHRALTKEETKVFFDNAKDCYYYDVFRMAIQTGMRIGEIGALKNSDIYDGKIHIERTITRNEQGGYEIGDNTKTWSGRRTIPLNKAISEIIEHQRKINVMLDGNVTKLDDLIFKAPERGLLLSTPADRNIKSICKRTGIEHFTCHAFRATFATRCIEQGIAPRTLQELLGHKDYSLTMNLYGHVVDDTKQKAMDNVKIAL